MSSKHSKKKSHVETKLVPYPFLIPFSIPTVIPAPPTITPALTPLVIADLNTNSYPSTADFTLPVGYKNILILAKGSGGGGGAGGSAISTFHFAGGGGGGGSGVFLNAIINNVSNGSSALDGKVKIGQGGTAGSATSTGAGGDGKNTTVEFSFPTSTPTITLHGGKGGGQGTTDPAVGGAAGADGKISSPSSELTFIPLAYGVTNPEFLTTPATAGTSNTLLSSGNGGHGGYPPGTLFANLGIDGGYGLGARPLLPPLTPIPATPGFTSPSPQQSGLGGNGGGGGYYSASHTSLYLGADGSAGTGGYVKLVALP